MAEQVERMLGASEMFMLRFQRLALLSNPTSHCARKQRPRNSVSRRAELATLRRDFLGATAKKARPKKEAADKVAKKNGRKPKAPIDNDGFVSL